MKREEMMDKRSLKKGIASAITQAMIVTVPIMPSHVAHPLGVLTKRMTLFLKTRSMVYLQTTTELMEPEMKITGRAIPKATFDTSAPADRRAGLWTFWPMKA